MEENFREIDLSGCPQIGKGQCSTVYQSGSDRVVKLFSNTFPRENINIEYSKTSEASNMEIGAPKCFGMVTYQDSLGMEIEYIRGKNLQEVLVDNADKGKYYAKETARQLKKIHSITPDVKLFTPISDFYLDCIAGCKKDGWISEEETIKLRAFVKAIPECKTMIHGDYHLLNILEEDGKLRMIDMADCMSGNPIYDLLIFNLYMHHLPANVPELYKMLVSISIEDTIQFYNGFIKEYFNTDDDKVVEKISRILDVFCMLKVMLTPYSFSNIDEAQYPMFVEMGRQGLMPVIQEYTGIIPKNIMDMAKL